MRLSNSLLALYLSSEARRHHTVGTDERMLCLTMYCLLSALSIALVCQAGSQNRFLKSLFLPVLSRALLLYGFLCKHHPSGCIGDQRSRGVHRGIHNLCEIQHLPCATKKCFPIPAPCLHPRSSPRPNRRSQEWLVHSNTSELPIGDSIGVTLIE